MITPTYKKVYKYPVNRKGHLKNKQKDSFTNKKLVILKNFINHIIIDRTIHPIFVEKF